MNRYFVDPIKLIILLLAAMLMISCFRTGPGNRLPCRQMEKHMLPLGQVPNGTALAGVLNKTNIPGPARVVGLGEAVHGSADFFRLKQAVFRYLVEKHGFNTLCYEFSFEQGLDIDRYIQGEMLDIDSILRKQYWIQANREVLELINWMRTYNREKPAEEKIHFVGIDNQLDMFRPSRLGYHIRRLDPFLAGKAGSILHQIESLGKPVYRGMNENTFNRIDSLLVKVLGMARQGSGEKKAGDQEIILHLLHSAILSHHFLFNVYNGGPNNRDRFMAENVLWAASFFGPGRGVAVWAHNAHVCASPDYNGGPSMGMVLRDSLGSRYLILGTAFSRGRITAVEAEPSGRDTPPHPVVLDTVPVAGSVNRLLEECSPGNCLIDLRKIPPGSRLYAWLDSVRPLLGVGDFFTGAVTDHYRSADRQSNVLKEYDILLYVRRINALHLLAEEENDQPQ